MGERQALSETTESSANGMGATKTDQWTPERLAGFWAAMRALYGHRWTQEWGPELHPLWERELRSVTPDEAALGWRACRKSGDEWPPTLPVFFNRVSEALKWQQRHDGVHQALPAPNSRSVPKAFKQAAKDAQTRADAVDVPRLANALGGKPSKIRIAPHRRTLLRGEHHPAGYFGLAALWQARGVAKQAGRSLQDMDSELAAYNGWTPDDEDRYQSDLARVGRSERRDEGATPFLDAWQSLETKE